MQKFSLSLIGVGAFGELLAKHLAPHVDLVLFDPHRNLSEVAAQHHAEVGTLKDAAKCDVVILSLPVQHMEQTLRRIAPELKRGAVVVDVASVKIKPAMLMQELLPPYVRIVGTHPLFGPQSGKDGIAGHNIVICPIRGSAHGLAERFCRQKLGLKVLARTPDQHDREMAHVQALPHLIARVMKELSLPPTDATTNTYKALLEMVRLVGGDSDQLFKAITEENPYAQGAIREFFGAAGTLENRLAHLTAK